MTNALTIQKEILKKEHDKTPNGIVEKKLRAIYDGLITKGEKLPEDICKDISDLRDIHENKQMDYLKERQRLDAIAVDKMLLETMTKELELIEKYQKDNGILQ